MGWRMKASAAAANARQGRGVPPSQVAHLLGGGSKGGGHLAPASVAAAIAGGQASHAWRSSAMAAAAAPLRAQPGGGSAGAASGKHAASAAIAARRRGGVGPSPARSSPGVGPRPHPIGASPRGTPPGQGAGGGALPLKPVSADAWLWGTDVESSARGMHPVCPQCGTALTLPVSVGDATSNVQILHKSPPTLTVSPCCRAPLPRCALSLLPLRLINPYLQLTHISKSSQVSFLGGGGAEVGAGVLCAEPLGRGIGGGGSIGWSAVPQMMAMLPAVIAAAHNSDVLVPSQRTSTSLGRWWHWCAQCGHAGEGHFMENWFAGNSVCPVSGCMCQCAKLDPSSLRRQHIALAPREGSATMQAAQAMEGHMRWGVLEGQRPPM